jgi:hypothetical protein
MKKISQFFVTMIVIAMSLTVLVIPYVATAQADKPLVPCGNVVGNDGVVTNPCEFRDFFTLIINVTDYVIILGAVISSIVFAYVGFMMMTAGGEMGRINEAKAIFGKVLVGFLIMISAWLIVHAINAGLISDSFRNESGGVNIL